MTQLGVWCVVVAAGSGARFGAPKQFSEIDGSRVVDRSVATAAEVCEGVVVVFPASALDQPVPPGATAVVAGGSTRSESSLAGVSAVPESAEVILVHDAARPLASEALFEAVITEVRSGAAAVVPVVPVTDSIRDACGAPVPREDLRAVQTPQGFEGPVLRAALESCLDASDDAQAVEIAGSAVVMIPGEPDNVKVTRPADLAFVKAVLGAADRGGRSGGGADDVTSANGGL